MKTLNKITKLIILGALFLSMGLADLTGAGATFPQPLYAKMFDAYGKMFGEKINYQAIGSGGGIKQLTEKIVDFGGTDAYLSDAEIAATGAKIVHIPICLGAVVLSYNLPGTPQLKFTPQLVSAIFLGKITKWNDPQIQAVNPGVALPAVNIVLAHRSDSSGTTAVFTDYLSKIDPQHWKKDKNFSTPAKLVVGGKGNSGVAGLIKQVPGTIGYIELTFAKQNNMAMGLLQNRAGKYVVPSLESVSYSADVPVPADTRVSLTNTLAEDGYPISGFTWIVVYREQNYQQRDLAKAQSLVKLLKWMIADGQKFTTALNYGPLPKSVVGQALANVNSITYNGKELN